MSLFRKLVYSKSPEELEYDYLHFKGHTLVCSYSQYVKYIDNLMMSKHEWSIGYLDNGLLRGNNSNNYSEAGIRKLKEKNSKE